MNGYVCFYRGKRTEVHADTILQARDKAVAHFKANKPWEVTAVLAELAGVQHMLHPASL